MGYLVLTFIYWGKFKNQQLLTITCDYILSL